MSSSNEMKLFESAQFGTLRVVEKDGDPWFVAKDVCDALGIVNSSDAVTRVTEEDKGVGNVETLGGVQQVRIISEPGLYQIILTARTEKAKPFQYWVTHDVLPSLRKNGVAMTESFATSFANGDPAALKALLTTCNQLLEHKEQAELKAKEAERARFHFNSEGGAIANKCKRYKNENEALKLENADLKDQLGVGETWKACTAIWPRANANQLKALGMNLSKFCKNWGYEIRSTPHPQWNTVNTYSSAAVKAFMNTDWYLLFASYENI